MPSSPPSTSFGVELLADGGSFTLKTGILSRQPTPGSAAISAANADLEGFVRAAALKLPRGLRINAVAPGWVRETLVVMKMDPDLGMPAAQIAQTYLRRRGKRDGSDLGYRSTNRAQIAVHLSSPDIRTNKSAAGTASRHT